MAVTYIESEGGGINNVSKRDFLSRKEHIFLSVDRKHFKRRCRGKGLEIKQLSFVCTYISSHRYHMKKNQISIALNNSIYTDPYFFAFNRSF